MVKDGESWARTRRAFSLLLEQWGDGATLASQYVGGQSVSRDHKADKDAHDPIVPVPGAKQRECLKFLTDAILSDKSFQFSPALLRRLGTERWTHWGNDDWYGFGPGVDISVLERILGIQKIVLGHCLSGSTLARLENQQLQVDPGADPLRMDEVFRSLTDGIWSDLDHLPAATDDKGAKFALSTIRRNLQREYLRRLGDMVLGNSPSSYGDMFSYVVFTGGGRSSVPADARALARLHLKEIASRISKVLETTEPDRSTTPAGLTSKSAGIGSPRFSKPISTSASRERPERQSVAAKGELLDGSHAAASHGDRRCRRAWGSLGWRSRSSFGSQGEHAPRPRPGLTAQQTKEAVKLAQGAMVELRKKTEGAAAPGADRREYVVGVELLCRQRAPLRPRDKPAAPAGRRRRNQDQARQDRPRTPRTQPRPGPRAIVTSYRYFDDITVFSTVDLGTGQVVKVEAAQHLRTPLSESEFEEAVEMAREKSEPGQAALRAIRRPAHGLSAVQPVHRQGRPAGPSGRSPDLPRRQARPELSAPAGRPDDARGRDARPRSTEPAPKVPSARR